MKTLLVSCFFDSCCSYTSLGLLFRWLRSHINAYVISSKQGKLSTQIADQSAIVREIASKQRSRKILKKFEAREQRLVVWSTYYVCILVDDVRYQTMRLCVSGRFVVRISSPLRCLNICGYEHAIGVKMIQLDDPSSRRFVCMGICRTCIQTMK